ncbi:cupredoxin domain-containing protein [Candidatus Nomurabacteria bacterium]|nr:cupredoxin domain-containing protein [Candidatus Nomurabacteria bacterium]
MNKKIILVIVVLVLVVGGYMIYKNNNAPYEPENFKVEQQAPATVSDDLNTDTNKVTEDTVKADEKAVGTVKEFTVDGSNFKFVPNTITVKKGDTVKLTLKNIQGFHDFKIDALNVATKQIKEGTTETVTFVADKVGSFEYYCSVGKHKAMGMVGTLTVQ